MNWRFGVAILVGVLLGSLLRAAEPDEQFVRIFALIQEADGLAEGGHKDLAAQKYREAQGSLIAFRKAHPGWNESVVDYRLKYIEEKLNVPANQPAISPADKTSDSPGGRGDSADLFRRLEEQIRQLKADKELLQDKLKEALIAQPAAVDPRELSKAEEKINALRKEIDVLRVNLQKAESKPDRPVDPVVLEETRKALAMAQRKVAEQTERAATLTLEKEALEKQLKASIDGVETKPKRVEDDAQGRREHDLETKVGKGTRALERDLSEAKAVGRTNALSPDRKSVV